MSRLKQKYDTEVVPRLKEELGLKNAMCVPGIRKIVLNMGIGIAEQAEIKRLTEELAVVTGQKPVVTKARKSISNFKLRAGMGIGAKVTLRRERMYDFLDRLIGAALPRIRDFRGVSRKSFDGRGNYTLGIKEQTIFPEIDPNSVSALQGMDITIVTSAESDEHALKLLSLIGMPFATG